MEGCKKTKFGNEEAALFYIKKLKDTSKKTSVPTRAYLCPNCNCWHLTSQTLNADKRVEKLNEKLKQYKALIVAKDEIINEKNSRIKKLNIKVNELEQLVKTIKKQMTYGNQSAKALSPSNEKRGNH